MSSFNPPRPPELIILIGLPGAGKSSFYRARFADTHALLSKDLMRHTRRGKTNKLAQMARDLLTIGTNVVIDNTNVTRDSREALLFVARDCGAHVTGYYFDVSREDCRARNAMRTGKACVPEWVIGMIGNQLQLPTYEEGFDTIFRVALARDGAPIIQDWNSEANLNCEIQKPEFKSDDSRTV